jgi:uracil-DNA glycosylase family 4
MAIELPLYTDYELPIEREHPIQLNKNCMRCNLSRQAIRTVCMPTVGNPNGLLFVGDYPGKEEDTVGRPYCGTTGKYLVEQVKKLWDGPYAFTNALSCRPLKTDAVTDKHILACRGYLAQAINDVNPQRIILTGGNPIFSFFGESIPVLSARKGVGWMWAKDDHKEEQIPVFTLMNPVNALRNKFLKKWFEQDLKWALTSDIESLWHPPLNGICRIVETEADAINAEEEITAVGGMTLDTETAGKMFNDYFKVLCIAICAYGSENTWVWTEKALNNKKTLEPLKYMLENKHIYKNGHNLKFDMEVINIGLQIKMRGFDNCTLLTRKLLWADSSARLRHMAYLVGMGGHKMEMSNVLAKSIDSINGARANSKKAVGFLPGLVDEIYEIAVKYKDIEAEALAYGLVNKNLLYRYCSLDAVASDRLRIWQKPQIEKKKSINYIWNKVVKGTSEAIAQVEMWGMPVSKKAVASYNDYLNLKLQEIRKRFEKQNINLGSPKQLSAYLYDDLGIKCRVFTDKGAPSTSKAALKLLAKRNPVVQDILNYRAFDKLRGSYAEGIIPFIRDDGRVHPNIKIAGTSSGRFSVTEPPVQTIPRGRDEHAKLARSVFIAPRGHKIIQLDFGTLEIKVAALLSGDPLMKKILAEGVDYHMTTARMISKLAWGIPPEKVTDEHRNEAKIINFAALYGQSKEGLASRIGCTVDQAEKTQTAIFGKFSVLKKWIDDCIEETNRTGFAYTWWDGHKARRRPLYQIANTRDDPKSQRSRGTAKRSSFNTPVQGTATEFCTRSLVECVNWITYSQIPAELILPVHDSLMFIAPDDLVDEVAIGARNIMTGWNSEDVKLTVDIKVGQTWGNLEKY